MQKNKNKKVTQVWFVYNRPRVIHLHMWNGEENVKTEEVKKEEEQERGQMAGVRSWEDQLRELAGKGLVLKLVLTGGPCGGKTLAQITRSGVLTSSTFCRQAEITRCLKELGWTVLCCPEVATIVFRGGVDPSATSAPGLLHLQEGFLRTVLALEDTFFEQAAEVAEHQGTSVLVICDRGTMDGAGAKRET